ncbi:hypothetical protein KAU09_04405 [Candidatus Parcubacteria bacterium]|nr:hypothetical protein [Candidatus Parcubacteria bacterium]
MSKEKKKNSKSKEWFLFFLFGGFLLKLVFFLFKKGKSSQIRKNFKKYINKEEKEIEEFSYQEENLPEFLHDSLRLFKDFFIPHKGNGHRPKILRARSLALIVFALAILKVSILAYVFSVNSYQAKMSENISGQIVDLINRDRKTQNLEPLEANAVLNSSAFSKAEDLIIKDYFAHYSPDGRKPWDFIDRGKYEYLYVGENLAMNFTSAKSAHQALMLSPTHKQNILSDKYSDIGIAVVNGELDGKRTNVLVQFFAVKKLAPIKIALAEDKTAGTTEITITEIEEKAIESDLAPKKEEIIDYNKEPVSVVGESYKQGSEEIKTIDTGRPDKLKIPDSIPIPIQKENSLSLFPKAKNIAGYNDKNLIAKAEISPNIAIEENIVTDVKSFNNIFDKNDIIVSDKVKAANVITIIVLGILFIVMIINIVVRAEIQHKKVFIHTIIAIICLTGIIYLNFSFPENILPKLLII